MIYIFNQLLHDFHTKSLIFNNLCAAILKLLYLVCYEGRCSERCGNDIIGFHRDKAELIHKSSPQPPDDSVDFKTTKGIIKFHFKNFVQNLQMHKVDALNYCLHCKVCLLSRIKHIDYTKLPNVSYN